MRFIRKSYLNGTILEDPIQLMIRNRLSKKRNQNFVCFWAGPTGSGKSYSAVSYFSKIDVNFGPENFISTMKELMTILITRKFRNGKDLVPGSIIVFDEFTSQVASTDWYSVINKVFIKVVSTFRDLNIGLCLTGPSLSLGEGKTPILLHAYFENDPDPIYKYALVKARVYRIIPNSRKKKVYTHHYNFVINGDKVKIPFILVGLPPKELIEQIEIQSKERKQDIREEGELSIESFLADVSSKRSRSDRFDPMLVGNQVLGDLSKYYYKASNGVTTINSRLIATDFGLSVYAAQTVAQFVKSKVDMSTGKILNTNLT